GWIDWNPSGIIQDRAVNRLVKFKDDWLTDPEARGDLARILTRGRTRNIRTSAVAGVRWGRVSRHGIRIEKLECEKGTSLGCAIDGRAGFERHLNIGLLAGNWKYNTLGGGASCCFLPGQDMHAS